MGHSCHTWFIDSLDLVIASVFTGLYLWSDNNRYRWMREFGKPIVPEDPRPYPDLSMRLTWLVLYLGLAIILWLTLWFQIEHLPELSR